MVDWNTPTTSTTKANVLTYLADKTLHAGKEDFTGDTNVPSGLIRWNATTLRREILSGGSWIALNDYASWTPSYSAAGSMTYTSVTTVHAKWKQENNTVYFEMFCSGTTGGTASNIARFTLPIAPFNAVAFAIGFYDPGRVGQTLPGLGETSGTTVNCVQYDNANWTIGGGRQIKCSGSYEV